MDGWLLVNCVHVANESKVEFNQQGSLEGSCMDVEVGGVAGQLHHPVSQTLRLFITALREQEGLVLVDVNVVTHNWSKLPRTVIDPPMHAHAHTPSS